MSPKAPHPNRGETWVLGREHWCLPQEIQGTDERVLNHPVMELAFQRVVELHQVRHPVAVLSLCSATRPYTRSRVWRDLRKHFGHQADLIVTSNGGIVPLRFEGCYPFMTYEAKGERESDELYKAKLLERLKVFFTAHRYQHLLFLYRPGLRNIPAATQACEELVAEGKLEGYRVLVPDYDKLTLAEREREGCKMFPHVHSTILAEAHATVDGWLQA